MILGQIIVAVFEWANLGGSPRSALWPKPAPLQQIRNHLFTDGREVD